jgi:hypothetical protein
MAKSNASENHLIYDTFSLSPGVFRSILFCGERESGRTRHSMNLICIIAVSQFMGFTGRELVMFFGA